MMPRKKIIKIFYLLVVIYVYINGIKTSAQLINLENLCIVFIEGEGLNAEEAEEKVSLLSNEKVSSVIWKSNRNVIITNSSLGNSDCVEQISYVGNAKLINPQCHNMENIHAPICTIDKETSYRLFGDLNELRGKVSVLGKDYIIDSTINDSEQVVINRASREENELNMLIVSNEKALSSIELVRKLSLVLGNDMKIIKFDWLLVISRIMLLLFPTIFIFRVIKMLLKDIAYRKWKIRLLYLIIIWGLLFLFYIAVIKNMKFPADIVVNKISEFQKWLEVFDNTKNDFLFLAGIEKSAPLMGYWKKFYITCACSLPILSIFLILPTLFTMRIDDQYIGDRI